MSNIIPIPRVPVSIRPATLADLPFIDALQKKQTRQVGWMPTKQLEGKVVAGNVLVAWAAGPCSSGEEGNTGWQPVPREERLGYCIAQDRYFKRDDCGIIYQLNVVPEARRSLVGAALIQAQFERSAYGCRLYCCWCAQDIEANRFWESIGFIPLAFRAGSRGRSARGQKGRVHIFWQRRIRAGDVTTPYWFPAQTSAGSIREDRLVLPIPPGVHWSDVMPVLLPTAGVLPSAGVPTAGLPGMVREPAGLPAPRARVRKKRAAVVEDKSIRSNGLRLQASEQAKPAAVTAVVQGLVKGPVKEPVKGPVKEPKQRRPKVKNDPAHVAAARELRDRYLEHLNGEHVNGEQLNGGMLPGGKYEVSRQIGAGSPALLLEQRAA